MPLLSALMAHFWLPGERTTPEKVAVRGLHFSVWPFRLSGAVAVAKRLCRVIF
jgi:hypothetical protein